ncbi:MAG: hypothetical protein OJI67_05580, partial [Prosthecobacter sp.]|nr:hypothetical protein [Prosthecobacter sp.]
CPDNLGKNTSLKLGINYLPKPFDVLDLLNAVGQALTTGITRGLLPAPKSSTGKIELPSSEKTNGSTPQKA